MKRKMLWIVLVLVLADVALVSNARASRRSFAGHRQPILNVEPSPLRAQQYYPVMTVTVLTPVQLPGLILMPGKYTFTLVHDNKNVSIAKSDGEFVGSFLILPAYRRDTSDGLVNTEDSPAGGPDRIASWFFPNQQDGYSFIYPTT